MANVNRDMRNMEVTGEGAKDVRDTKMLSPTAREPMETTNRDNPQSEYINKGGANKGPFGAKGHGGN